MSSRQAGSTGEEQPAPAAAGLERPLRLALMIAGSLLAAAGALAPPLLGASSALTTYFLQAQDAPALAVAGVALVALAVFPAGGGMSSWVAGAARIPRRAVWALAGIAGVASLVGTYVVFKDFPLSRDEVMADFDAAILREGRLVAPVPPDWRPFAAALQPLFRLPVPGDVAWISAYLPGNAALRALVSLVLPIEFTGPLLAGVAILAAGGCARRLWPARPDAAIVASLLVATSPQVLFTAMTPYAMTAHLALNLVWLWLFLRDDRAGHAAALAVGFLACGLHQLVFHPIFVAPFLLHLGLAGRYRLAAIYVGCYAGIGLFWASYWRFALAGTALPPEIVADAGAPFFLRRVLDVLGAPTLNGVNDMAKNLLRFAAWQNPLAWPLSALGIAVAWRQPGLLRPLALGIALNTAVVFLLLPYQGHGWGYRYLHGFIGSIALLATAGWVRASSDKPSAAASALAGRCALVAVLVLTPFYAQRIASFVWPYADSHAAILRAPQELVIVDPEGIGFGQDLVRNDPFLRGRPKLLDLASLTEPELRDLCGRFAIGLFDRRQAASFGLPVGEDRSFLADNRALLGALACGTPIPGAR